MEKYKYFSDRIRVKLTNDEKVKTTIIAVFQRRWLVVIWMQVREVNFDVFDYSKLPNGPDVNSKPINEYNPSPYQPITVTYGEKSSRELWKPEYFNLENSLQTHFRKITSIQPM